MSDKSTFVLSRLEKPDLLLQQNHSDILSRVKSFLPQISAANRILEDNQKAGVSEESIVTVEDLSALDSDDDDEDHSCSDSEADEKVDGEEKVIKKTIEFDINLLAEESDEDERTSGKKLVEEVRTKDS